MSYEPSMIDEQVRNFTREGQDPQAVRLLLHKIPQMLLSKEEIKGIFLQERLVLNAGIILTNERMIFHRPTVVGGAYIEEFWWKFLVDARIEEGVLTSVFMMNLRPESGMVKDAPITVGLDWIPKRQARRLYSMAKEFDNWWNDEWRRRHLEENTAATGGFGLSTLAKMKAAPISPSAPTLVTQANNPQEAEQALMGAFANVTQAASPQPAPSGDPVERLKQLKNLLDCNAISRDEYNKKKAEILSQI